MTPYLILVAAAAYVFCMGAIAIDVIRQTLTPFLRWCVAGIVFMFGIPMALDLTVFAARMLGWMP